MTNYWCVNFVSVGYLHHGIRNKLWLMGYQYERNGPDSPDTPGRKGAITKNWKRLEKIAVGDKLVAYLPGNKFFATATVVAPRRPKTSGDRIETISEYLKRGNAHKRGHVYFPPSVAYENFTDECSDHPVRIDVDQWENFVPEGVSVNGPTFPRNKTVYAAFDIEKDRFDSITSNLSGDSVTSVFPEEVDSSKTYLEGAAQTKMVNAYERSRKARAECIERYGWDFAVCGYNMGELYGTLGEGVIHVHHLRELAALGKEYKVDPTKDLRPVCPNCHAILHTSSPAMTIQHLRKVLSDRKDEGKTIKWPKTEPTTG